MIPSYLSLYPVLLHGSSDASILYGMVVALQCYQEACRIKPDYATGYYNVGTMYVTLLSSSLSLSLSLSRSLSPFSFGCIFDSLPLYPNIINTVFIWCTKIMVWKMNGIIDELNIVLTLVSHINLFNIDKSEIKLLVIYLILVLLFRMALLLLYSDF